MQRQDLESTQDSSKEPIVKRKKYRTVFAQIVFDFAENTSLNGFKYMADGPSYIDKLFWFFIFLISAVYCFFMVYKTYLKWETSAVIITLMEHLVPVQETPFPAVTICPQAKIKQEYFNFFEAYETYQTDETPEMTRLENTSYHSALVFCQRNISTDIEIQLPPSTLLKKFRTMAPKHSDVFESCEWRGRSCKNQFREVLTADGICYTFNTLSAYEIYRETSAPYKSYQYYLNASLRQKHWSLDTNAYSSSGYVYPRRGRANGLREDLHIVLKEIKDRDFYCDKHTRPGYKVYLHHPADPPQAALHYYAAHPERTTSLAVKLNILTTSNEVADYDPDDRQCYFPEENELKFFKTYTQKNCQLECLSKFTFDFCGCVDFYMPRNPDTNICSANSVNCVKNALDRYILNGTFISNCDCLPSCYDIQYDADVVVNQFDQKEYNANKNWILALESEEFDDDDEDVENGTMSGDDGYDTEESDDDEDDFRNAEIRIYYRQPQFVAMVRSEMFGLSQFLADCGGTLGLFLGFSLLTIAEIVYFFTIKLCCHIRRERVVEKIEKSNDIDEIEGKYINMDNQNITSQ